MADQLPLEHKAGLLLWTGTEWVNASSDASGVLNTNAIATAGTQYTEDAAAAANPVGSVPILVRKDTPSATVTTDGDNIAQRGTDFGAAYTTILTSTGTVVDTFGGGTQYTEDAAAAANPVGNMQIARRKDTLSAVEVSADGDNIAVNATSKGEVYVKQTDAVPITDNSGSLTVDYATTGSGNATGAVRVELPTNGTGVIATVGAVTAITNALPAGTNAIGKLAANSGVDIGDVDVTTVGTITPGTAATSLGKAEDVASASGDVGVMALAVRADSPAATSGTTGDYEPLQTAAGLLWTRARGAQDSGGTDITDTTAHAIKVLSVDSAGTAVSYVDRLTDNVGVALQTDIIMNDTTPLTPKFKTVSVAASQTDTSLIAAVASKKLRILCLRAMCGGTATDSTYESDGGSDTILHVGTYGANGGEVLPFSPVGWFETVAGEALIVTTGAGSTTKYTLVYIEV